MKTLLLKAEKVGKAFGGIQAISELDLSLHEGEILGLIGPNGSGKTTFFNLITGMCRLDRGRIFFQGQDISNFHPFQICHLGIGRTFQTVRPFPAMTLLENVLVAAAFGKLDRTRGSKMEKARKALSFLGLEKKMNDLAGSLTLGEKKRLELSRVLATNPSVILLDEVMGGLSFEEMDEMMEALRKIHDRGLGIIVIEHVMRAILGLVERIVVLHHGLKIAEGKPAEITQDPKVIESYLGEDFLISQNLFDSQNV